MFQEQVQSTEQNIPRQHTQIKSSILQNWNHDLYQHAASCLKINWKAIHEPLINPKSIKKITKKIRLQRIKKIPQLSGYLTRTLEQIFTTGNSQLICLWVLSVGKFKLDPKKIKSDKNWNYAAQYNQYILLHPEKAKRQKIYIRSRLKKILKNHVQYHFRLSGVNADEKLKLCKYYRSMKVIKKLNQFQDQNHRLHHINRTMNFIDYLRSDGEIPLKIESTKTFLQPTQQKDNQSLWKKYFNDSQFFVFN